MNMGSRVTIGAGVVTAVRAAVTSKKRDGECQAHTCLRGVGVSISME